MPRRDAGFALLAALWLVVAVGLVLAETGAAARARRAAPANAVSELRARAAADAGLQHALGRLRRLARETEGVEAADAARRWNRLDAVISGLQDVRLPAGAAYSVTAEDGGRRLSVNAASVGELRRLLVGLGLKRRRAEVAARSIADWRDADGLHRARGAEWEDHYRHLDPPVVPRNGPIRSLEELAWIRGLGSGVAGEIEEHLSVAAEGKVNLNVAPRPVLEALPGLTPAAVGAILRRRHAAPLRNLFELEALLDAGSRARLLEAFAALSARTTFAASRIRVVSRGTAGRPEINIVLVATVVRRGHDVEVTGTWRR